ncbi:metal ion transporter [Octadecabacter arcticus 238]|uniref:Metal ion transporter n=1 Tax=Octadecabacter arcticus 238 TaxID=391616 RepID=M9RFD3_9RHOB|nr:zinc transporter ZntB [Octadecabacter arcticus]AGI70443.1 metal ion transporter [Octadecabacter arcticus 238]
MLPTPVCAFDITPDGVATPCGVDDAQSAGWRWLHFDLADPELGDWLRDTVPASVAAALQLPETRPRFDMLTEGALINLRGVNLNPGAMPEDMVGLRIWATADRVITVRRRKIMALDAARQEMALGHGTKTPSAFLAEVAEGLTRRIEVVSLTLEDRVDEIEELMVTRKQIDADEVLDLRQSLIKLRRFIGPQREALVDFSVAKGGLPDIESAPHVLETANRAARTVEALDAARDRMAVMQEHLDMQTAAALGRNGYVLSIVAAIFLPLGFLTGLFGVNIAGMPGMNTPWAFAALCGVSVVLGLVLYLLFRALKWL